jgi:hydrogenase nickel incorporation protein HypA/HybF
MHEMSLASSLLEIIRQEMEKHPARRLLLVRLRCGVLTNVVPEALSMAFDVQTSGTSFAGTKLELRMEPLCLRCGCCGREFFPEGVTHATIFSVCPACGEEIGHSILTGKELYIDHIELE